MNELTKKALTNVVLGGSMVLGMMAVKATTKLAIKRYKERVAVEQEKLLAGDTSPIMKK